jgi:uncharacterized protein YdhG (YjbR/CyaY superfamily)
MPRAAFRSIDDYIDAQPLGHRHHLEQVRRAIARALPGAEEGISYNIPAFRMNGRIVLYFAGFKEHYSIYPASDALISAMPAELEGRRSSKGTLRFSFAEPVPKTLIERVAKFRATEFRGAVRKKA